MSLWRAVRWASFLMRQYIGSAIPRELIEAARMDGCSEFGIYWRIVVPLIKPALGTLGLVVFIGQWNNFMGPLVVMNDMEMYYRTSRAASATRKHRISALWRNLQWCHHCCTASYGDVRD